MNIAETWLLCSVTLEKGFLQKAIAAMHVHTYLKIRFITSDAFHPRFVNSDQIKAVFEDCGFDFHRSFRVFYRDTTYVASFKS